MINPPTIQYRKDQPIIRLKENNMFDVKTIKESEELFYTNMLNVRRTPGKFERLNFFISSMSWTIGDWITYDYLIDLLEWLELSIEDIENYILFSKQMKFWRVDSIQFRWYLELMDDHKNDRR